MLRILKIKTITKFQPHYFSRRISATITGGDENVSLTSIDLGHYFWNSVFNEDQLLTRHLSNRQLNNTASAQFLNETSKHALLQLGRAKEVLANCDQKCPDGEDLWYSFRIISRCLEIFNEAEKSFAAHLARGYLPLHFNYHSIGEILRAIEQPHKNIKPFPKDLLLNCPILNDLTFDVAIFTPRNDVDFCQIISLCQILKARNPNIKTILSAAGANEQLDFGAWINPILNQRNLLSKYIDYFIPREDYGLAVSNIIEHLSQSNAVAAIENVIPLESDDHVDAVKNEYDWKKGKASSDYQDKIDSAFLAHNAKQQMFFSSGLRSITIRLSNERCHWAACDFCTINSQHLLRNGNRRVDYRIETYVKEAIKSLKAKQIQSVVFTDEALHPDVLSLLAKSIISSGLNIVYRARARFTEAFYSKDFCELLGASGLRYLGCGLEAASPRINRLVNKNVTGELDYDLILQNLEDAGIRPHIYSIMNFPTETQPEIALTRDFLVRVITKYKYVTVSPNLFFLMEGSRVLSNHTKYSIQSVEKSGDLSLTLSFRENEASKNNSFAKACVADVHAAQFQVDVHLKDDAERFWYFIDQSGIFYQQKVAFEFSPYKKMNNVSVAIERFNLACITLRYTFSFPTGKQSFVIVDWVSLNYCEVDSQVHDIIDNWNDRISVNENLRGDHQYLPVIYELFQMHCFRLNNSKDIIHSNNKHDCYAHQC